MAELADALDLGSSPERGAGSSPVICTIKFDEYCLVLIKKLLKYLTLLLINNERGMQIAENTQTSEATGNTRDTLERRSGFFSGNS